MLRRTIQLCRLLRGECKFSKHSQFTSIARKGTFKSFAKSPSDIKHEQTYSETYLIKNCTRFNRRAIR